MKVGSRDITISNSEKMLYPESKYDKQSVADYYRRIAEHMLPHIENRCLVVQRFPDGIASDGFYQKQVPDYFPDWIGRHEVPLKQGGTQELLRISSAEELVYLADQACLSLHRWLSKIDDLERTDLVVFDLDPADDDFSNVKQAARDVGRCLARQGLSISYLLSGSRGIHVYGQLDGPIAFDAVRDRAMQIAEDVVEVHPERYTVEPRKKDRRGKLYLDTTRNAYGQTVIAPYSLRARVGAPVATPIDGSELSRIESSDSYRMKNIFRRLSQRE